MSKKRGWGRLIHVGLCGIFCGMSFTAEARPDPILSWTHQVPSPLLLAPGTFVLGTSSAFALTSFLQVETEPLAFFYGIGNITLRTSLYQRSAFAMGAFLGYQTLNWRTFSPQNPEAQWRLTLPGVSAGYAWHSDWAIFMLIQKAFFTGEDPSWRGSHSSWVQTTQTAWDLTWIYARKKSKPFRALSGGISYSWMSSLVGLGMSHHWQGLQVGFHWLPHASPFPIRPLFVGQVQLSVN